ncbi:hypothetical protein DB30_03779 [Enhygromyxa salina]|uniref:Uncharacterized protein n=1 Tax=Enhygromyxa salina TaxID=215803 RepID=A0A0C2DBR2_9BACT|nr:hypothetical protein [Enhygromyxa salina]KIG17182.1 hypothetical protein DB30_03779 [Enhygromyxa salina]
MTQPASHLRQRLLTFLTCLTAGAVGAGLVATPSEAEAFCGF